MKTATSKPSAHLRAYGTTMTPAMETLFDNMVEKFKGREVQVGALFSLVSILSTLQAAAHSSDLYTTGQFASLQDIIANNTMQVGEAMGLSMPAVTEVVQTFSEIMSYVSNGEPN